MSSDSSTSASAPVAALLPDDPCPLPPNRPDDDACCGSGCDPCIFDFYYEELASYRKALKEWQARHPGVKPQ